jgi:lactate dehydrogenase-like 2-hydroxyacid dehydrogenase
MPDLNNAPRVLVCRRLPVAVEDRLSLGFRATLCADASGLARDRLLERVADHDALCPTVADRIDREVIERAAPRVRIIANFGVGHDNIDLEAARAAGIVVSNTPGVLTDATADLAIALMLAAARRLGEGERLCRSGEWNGWQPTQLLGVDLHGKTLGLVGFGRIGRAVARRARHGFGMRLLTFTRSALDAATRQQFEVEQCASLENLLKRSDFVSLHCPSTAQTRHLIDGAALAAMKAGATLINTARGDLVDEAALARALREGGIRAAGLDVHEHEPALNPQLLDLENVVLLPHLGSATLETRMAMGMRMVDNLTAFFETGAAPDRVA